MKPIVFISGPMRGYPNNNREAFFEAARYAESLGYIVLNPAFLPSGLEDTSYMPICLSMLDGADVMYVLPGGDNSAGSVAEQKFAEVQNIRILRTKKELENFALWWDDDAMMF